jgi:transposase InsO family protein
MSDVLYVPSFPFQLLSVSKITSNFNYDRLTKKTIDEGFFLHGLYYVFQHNHVPKSLQTSFKTSYESLLWHRCLGHPSDYVLSKINSVSISKPLECEIFHFSKSSKLPFNNSTTHVSHVFELIHSDVWEPFNTSLNGYKYFITFIDDFSRVIWVYLLKAKSDVFSCFQDFHTLIKNQFSSHLKTFRSDNGSEYMSKDMTHYLHSNGILHQSSYIGTPQQNGVSEWKNHDMLEKTRAIMLQMHVPKGF